MDRSFLCSWAKGFENGLNELDKDSRSCLLQQCAKACADTGVLISYQKLYKKVNGDRDAFYRSLSELGGVRGEVVASMTEYYMYFPECGCDLHNDLGVDTPVLCECSRQSIIYVAKSIWQGSKVKVEQLETVLSGDKECKFRIIFE